MTTLLEKAIQTEREAWDCLLTDFSDIPGLVELQEACANTDKQVQAAVKRDNDLVAIRCALRGAGMTVQHEEITAVAAIKRAAEQIAALFIASVDRENN